MTPSISAWLYDFFITPAAEVPITMAWLRAFVCTQAVEVPVYVALIRASIRSGHCGRPRGVALQILLAFGASAITHPMVWFVIPRIPSSSFVEYAVRAEAFAVCVEAFYFYSLHIVYLRRALVWSLLANGASVVAGEALRALFGWP